MGARLTHARRLLSFSACVAMTLVSAQAQEVDLPRAKGPLDSIPKQTPATMPREAAGPAIDKAAAFLVGEIRADGSWGNDAPTIEEIGFALNTFRSWRIASHGIVCMALASLEETPERRAALERAVGWLCDCELPKRDSDWDIDYVWSSLYGFTSTVELLGDPRFQAEPWRARLLKRGNEFLTVLMKHQAASGGWAYYDDPPFSQQPTWATSFCTALVLPALHQAEAVGIEVAPKVKERALRYLNRCVLPNGAYSYDLDPVLRLNGVEHINLIEGSLGRTQVGNWARGATGDRRVTHEVIREGLEAFFLRHGFLDHARMRPIPHEGFHANAGYFYFFAHYYASKVIELLPLEEREAWHARLRPHLIKTQRENGSTSDFLDSEYSVNAGTAFLVLALRGGLTSTVPAVTPTKQPQSDRPNSDR